MPCESSHANPIHFFRIILKDENFPHQELKIPPRFLRKLRGKFLPNPVTLRVPDGLEWEVNWIERDGYVWFEKADWEKFAEYYSLVWGHNLFFRYKGGSHFKVFICDKSTVEIDYPIPSSGRRRRCTKDDCEKINQIESESELPSLEVLGDNNKRPSKKMKTNTDGEPKSFSKSAQSQSRKLDKTKINVGFEATRQKVTGGDSREGVFNAKNGSKPEAVKKRTIEDTDSRSALERAKAFNSKNPFFYREIHRSYLQQDLLVIRTEFAKAYLDSKAERPATISVVGDNRTWPTRLKFSVPSNRFTLCCGWKSFAQHYNLKEGDYCAFEMITQRKAPLSFKITIFQATTEPCSVQLQGASRGGKFNAKNSSKTKAVKKRKLEDTENSSVLKRAMAFYSKNPHFHRRIYRSYLRQDMLAIPNEFSKKYLDSTAKGNATISVVGENMNWHVRLSFSIPINRFSLTFGWKLFAEHYNLKIGDYCAFEMTQRAPVQFKITIFRAREEPSSVQLQAILGDKKRTGSPLPCSQPSKKMRSNSERKPKRRRKIEQTETNVGSNVAQQKVTGLSRGARTLCPKNPYFICTLNSTYLRKHFLYIPNDFMNRCVTCHGNYVNLQVGEKPWLPVKVIYYADHKHGMFSAGWSAFVRGCNLKEGDVCRFEMVDEENLLIKVSISSCCGHEANQLNQKDKPKRKTQVLGNSGFTQGGMQSYGREL